MKPVAKMMIGAALLTAFGMLGAQEAPAELNSVNDWNKNARITEADGVINVKNNTGLYSKKKFVIDPAKKYTLKLTCRAVNIENEGDKSQVFAGFSVFDKKGRILNSFNCCVVPGTMTEVVEDAPKGATVVKVKDASKFRKLYGTLNADAKEDLSDLPNFNMLGYTTAFEKKDDAWEITLLKPLARPLKAGTMVRQHSRGGYLYTAGWKMVGKEWVTLSGSISGIKKGFWTGKFWPEGAAKAQVVILANWQKKNLETQIKDISITVE